MKKLLLSSLIITLTGCMNIMYHVPPEQVTEVYKPTCYVACNGVGSWWNTEFKKKYPIEAAWMELTWLVWVVDLPCEAVADTLTLPYDWYRKSVYEEAQAKKTKSRFAFGLDDKPQYELNGEYKFMK